MDPECLSVFQAFALLNSTQKQNVLRSIFNNFRHSIEIFDEWRRQFPIHILPSHIVYKILLYLEEDLQSILSLFFACEETKVAILNTEFPSRLSSRYGFSLSQYHFDEILSVSADLQTFFSSKSFLPMSEVLLPTWSGEVKSIAFMPFSQAESLPDWKETFHNALPQEILFLSLDKQLKALLRKRCFQQLVEYEIVPCQDTYHSNSCCVLMTLFPNYVFIWHLSINMTMEAIYSDLYNHKTVNIIPHSHLRQMASFHFESAIDINFRMDVIRTPHALVHSQTSSKTADNKDCCNTHGIYYFLLYTDNVLHVFHNARSIDEIDHMQLPLQTCKGTSDAFKGPPPFTHLCALQDGFLFASGWCNPLRVFIYRLSEFDADSFILTHQFDMSVSPDDELLRLPWDGCILVVKHIHLSQLSVRLHHLIDGALLGSRTITAPLTLVKANARSSVFSCIAVNLLADCQELPSTSSLLVSALHNFVVFFRIALEM